MIRIFMAMILALPLLAGDTAVLVTGHRLEADRIERSGDTFVLHIGGGRVELSAAEVAEVEYGPAPLPAVAAEVAPEPRRALSPKEMVTEAARRHGLPEEFVHSVAMAESAYHPRAMSPKGAIGVMQLMPGTARYLQADPYDVEQNIDAGTRLLRELLLKFQDDPNQVRRALAAYNAGEGAVRKYNGVPPYRETQVYVERVIGHYWRLVGRERK
jgi:soluble lytic murein transglycosylase-like protein